MIPHVYDSRYKKFSKGRDCGGCEKTKHNLLLSERKESKSIPVKDKASYVSLDESSKRDRTHRSGKQGRKDALEEAVALSWGTPRVSRGKPTREEGRILLLGRKRGKKQTRGSIASHEW